MLVDTSILIPIFRDKSGRRSERFRRFLRGRDFVLSRLTQLEVLQGCKSEPQWETLNDYFASQDYLEMTPEIWSDAARIYFDLERSGKRVGSVLDCCIAQIAIENRVPLIHNDRDFDIIGQFRKIRLHRLDIQAME